MSPVSPRYSHGFPLHRLITFWLLPPRSLLLGLPFLGRRSAGWCGKGNRGCWVPAYPLPQGEVGETETQREADGCTQCWKFSTCGSAWPWKRWHAAPMDVGYTETLVHPLICLCICSSIYVYGQLSAQSPSIQVFILHSFIPSIHPSTRPSFICPSFIHHHHLSILPSIYPSIYLTIYTSIIHNIPFYLYIHSFIHHLSVHSYFHTLIIHCLSIHPLIYHPLSIHRPVYLSFIHSSTTYLPILHVSIHPSTQTFVHILR